MKLKDLPRDLALVIFQYVGFENPDFYFRHDRRIQRWLETGNNLNLFLKQLNINSSAEGLRQAAIGGSVYFFDYFIREDHTIDINNFNEVLPLTFKHCNLHLSKDLISYGANNFYNSLLAILTSKIHIQKKKESLQFLFKHLQIDNNKPTYSLDKQLACITMSELNRLLKRYQNESELVTLLLEFKLKRQG